MPKASPSLDDETVTSIAPPVPIQKRPSKDDTIRWTDRNLNTTFEARVNKVSKPNESSGMFIIYLKPLERQMPLPVNYIHSTVAYENLPPAIPELQKNPICPHRLRLSSGGLPLSTKKTNKKGTPPSKAPASSTTKVPENVNFNIWDRVHFPKF